MHIGDLPVDMFLALLLAVAAGWFGHQVLRRRESSVSLARTEPFSREYFDGLNHLLNEQPDKALDVLKGLAEADANTVETQLALGHLYRRRGEVDKAIRIHDSVMHRQDMSPALRDEAAFALGEDYLRAGLLDRAEECFARLADSTTRRGPALRNLLSIFEQQRDWPQAIAVFEQLQKWATPEHPTALAHYYCELAETAHREAQPEQARQWLDKAFAVQRHFPRGNLLNAELALNRADPRETAQVCKRVMELHPHLLPVALPRYAQALRALNVSWEDAEESIALRIAEPKQRAALGYAAIVANLLDEPYLLRCLPDFLRHDANLGDLVQSLAGGDATQLTDIQLRALATGLAKIFRRTQRFRCVTCGISTGSHFWQCPGCHSWDTLAPVSRLELAPVQRS